MKYYTHVYTSGAQSRSRDRVRTSLPNKKKPLQGRVNPREWPRDIYIIYRTVAVERARAAGTFSLYIPLSYPCVRYTCVMGTRIVQGPLLSLALSYAVLEFS